MREDLNRTEEGERADWPPTIYPCELNKYWRCPSCNKTHRSVFYSAEPGDSDSDSFDFHCECGAYFKKFGRVPCSHVDRTTWTPA